MQAQSTTPLHMTRLEIKIMSKSEHKILSQTPTKQETAISQNPPTATVILFLTLTIVTTVLLELNTRVIQAIDMNIPTIPKDNCQELLTTRLKKHILICMIFLVVSHLSSVVMVRRSSTHLTSITRVQARNTLGMELPKPRLLHMI